ncbi:PREDICTED: protein saal1-like [Acropora digitifera]|uniref:protein saal1-like n=1 Tax=Acropora digitifera TaxID=70779 RepID=UPI00077B1867|nr:PREDICTED: protein saal1-like [Acropora digitifera]
MEDRNPSPPVFSAEEIELIQYDNIGETVFSKKWVLSTLMKLVESVQVNIESSEGVPNDEQLQPQGEGEDPQDLDDAFERELCELWDMSMNADVASFLQEMETTDVLLDAVLKSQNVRVTEICVGILANMACNYEVCAKMISNRELMDIIPALLEEPDAPVLVEATRLINVCLSNNEALSKWMEVLETEAVFKNFIYILENSLNVDLLTNCSQLVDKVLDSSDEMLKKWADLPLVTAICEAMKQMHMRWEFQNNIMTYMIEFQATLKTCGFIYWIMFTVVQGLVSCVSVVPLLCHFIAECGHDEGGIIVGREVSLTESFSVMNVILLADPITVLTAMEKDPRIMKVLLGLLGYSCKIHRKLSKSNGERLSLSEGDEHKFDRSLSSEEAQTSKGHSSNSEEKLSSSRTKDKQEPGGETDVSSTDQSGVENNIPVEPGEPGEPKTCFPKGESSSKDVLTDQGGTNKVSVSAVHHQYFEVATCFLKDIISESAKAPKCVFNMLAPHETLLQKIVHYASRIAVYNTLISDLVKSTLSISELSVLHEKLAERLYSSKVQSSSTTES